MLEILTTFPINTVAYLEDDSESIGILPWPATGPHLQNYTTETPDVNLPVVTMLLAFPSSLNNFWRHPKDGTLHRGVYTIFVNVICSFGDAEVRDFTDPRRVHKNVISFQVLKREGRSE